MPKIAPNRAFGVKGRYSCYDYRLNTARRREVHIKEQQSFFVTVEKVEP